MPTATEEDKKSKTTLTGKIMKVVPTAVIMILSFLGGATGVGPGAGASPSPHLLVFIGGLIGATLGAIVAMKYIVGNYAGASYALGLWALFFALFIWGGPMVAPFKTGLAYGAVIGVTFIMIVTLMFMAPGPSDGDE